MNRYQTSYSIGFTDDEKQELLEIVRGNKKWEDRINGAFGHVINTPSYMIPNGSGGYNRISPDGSPYIQTILT